jgi:hypothetical protein
MAKKTTEQFIESAKPNHEDKFDYSKSLYISEKIELKVICKEHGEFLTLPPNHIKSDTGGCSKCFDASSGINKIIIHDNKYGQFITSDIKLFNKLKNLLSYKTAGVEYTAAYKNGWNGVNYLLDKEGIVLEKTEKQPDLPLLIVGSNPNLKIGDNFSEPEIKKVIEILYGLKTNLIEAAIEPTAKILDRIIPIHNMKDISDERPWKNKRR